MSTTPTLPRTPSVLPPPTRPGVRRILAVIGAIALVAAILAVAYATGGFGSVDRDTTPIAEPDDTTPDEPEVVPDTSDDVVQDLPDDAPPTPRYGEELRANWDVTGVAASDVLNVRDGPGATFPIVATLAYDAAEFESTGRIAEVGDQLWREIIVPGDGVGWVNAAYLTETG